MCSSCMAVRGRRARTRWPWWYWCLDGRPGTPFFASVSREQAAACAGRSAQVPRSRCGLPPSSQQLDQLLKAQSRRVACFLSAEYLEHPAVPLERRPPTSKSRPLKCVKRSSLSIVKPAMGSWRPSLLSKPRKPSHCRRDRPRQRASLCRP